MNGAETLALSNRPEQSQGLYPQTADDVRSHKQNFLTNITRRIDGAACMKGTITAMQFDAKYASGIPRQQLTELMNAPEGLRPDLPGVDQYEVSCVSENALAYELRSSGLEQAVMRFIKDHADITRYKFELLRDMCKSSTGSLCTVCSAHRWRGREISAFIPTPQLDAKRPGHYVAAADLHNVVIVESEEPSRQLKAHWKQHPGEMPDEKVCNEFARSLLGDPAKSGDVSRWFEAKRSQLFLRENGKAERKATDEKSGNGLKAVVATLCADAKDCLNIDGKATKPNVIILLKAIGINPGPSKKTFICNLRIMLVCCHGRTGCRTVF